MITNLLIQVLHAINFYKMSHQLPIYRNVNNCLYIGLLPYRMEMYMDFYLMTRLIMVKFPGLI